MGTKTFSPVNTLAEETVDGSCVSAMEELDGPFNRETLFLEIGPTLIALCDRGA
jgi:hypothetical protein